MNLIVPHLQMSMLGNLSKETILSKEIIDFFSSVMYRKYKENKDNEYEIIIKKQVNESRLVAEQEGITIPKTLDDYVAPSRAGALGSTGKNGKKPGRLEGTRRQYPRHDAQNAPNTWWNGGSGQISAQGTDSRRCLCSQF